MEGMASTDQFKDGWNNGCFIDIYMILRTQFFFLSFQDLGLYYISPLKLDRYTPRRKVCVVHACVFSHSVVSDSLQLHGLLSHQAPLCMQFSRQE